MMTPIHDALVEQLRAALHPDPEGPFVSLTEATAGRHPADIAAALRDLSLGEALAIFRTLHNDCAAEVLDELDPETTRHLLDNAPSGQIAAALDQLPMDDAAQIVSEATDERAAQLLADLAARAPEDAGEVRGLLTHGEDSAGRLMTDKFAAVPPQATAAQVLQYLRANAHVLETVNDAYVVDEGGRLVGVASMRQILIAGDWQPVRDFMTIHPIAVTSETDQQEVARAMARYDLTAMPVTDATGRLVGIVTVDDVIDVMAEEFNEDYLRLVGSDAEEMDRRTPAQVARLRLPWLLGTMGIELCAGLVISHFEAVLTEVILLASFMPVISAISGNVGLQAAAIVVRGLDTGHVRLAGWWRQVRKELATAFLLAVVCGAVLGTIGSAWSRHIPFGIVIGAALLCSMLTAGLMGSVIPMLSKRMGFDPATTAGPFETAFQDVIGFAVFLWLASLMIRWLQ
jgi:magnesium transporter